MIAAITAGGRVDGELARAMGTDVKALASIGAWTMLDRAIASARAGGAVRVVVIGGDEIRNHCDGSASEVIADAPDGRENLRRALDAAAGAPLLLMSSDLPFVDGDSVRAFLRHTRDAEVAMPLASEAAYRAAYPGAPPHIVDVGGQRVANGSVFFLAPGVAPRILAVAQQLFAARKSLARMAVLLGPALLVRYALRKLRIEHIEDRAQQKLGLRARAVLDASPALCYDVDSLDDYRYAIERAGRSA